MIYVYPPTIRLKQDHGHDPHYRLSPMAIKCLLFALLPLLCSGNDPKKTFDQLIEGTESKSFFEKVFNKIETNKGNIYSAYFDLDSTLISSSMSIPILVAQIRRGLYHFGSEGAAAVFGFTTVKNKECITISHDYKIDGGENKVTISFETIVEEILKIFMNHEKIHGKWDETNPRQKTFQIEDANLKVLVAFWSDLAYRRMVGNKECKYLLKTIKQRVLLNMPQHHIDEFIEEAKNVEAKNEYEEYTYRVSKSSVTIQLRRRRPDAYAEQLALIRKFKELQVVPYIITGNHEMNLLAAIKIHNIGVNPDNIVCSRPTPDLRKTEILTKNDALLAGVGYTNTEEAKLKAIQKIEKEKDYKPLFATGDSEGDFHMLEHVLNEGGFALIIQKKKPLHSTLMGLIDTPKYKKRIHIQRFNPEKHATLAKGPSATQSNNTSPA